MSRKANDKRWKSKFGRFVLGYGAEKLAADLAVGPTAVYAWVSGRASPHPANALTIQKLARRRRILLSLDDIYEHFREVRSKKYAPQSRPPQHAAP